MNQGFDWHVEVKEVGEPGAIDGVQKAGAGGRVERSWLDWSKKREMNSPQLFG